MYDGCEVQIKKPVSRDELEKEYLQSIFEFI